MRKIKILDTIKTVKFNFKRYLLMTWKCFHP